MTPVVSNTTGTENTSRNAASVARSIYRELRANGCGTDDILAICTQMLDEVTVELRAEGPGSQAPAA